MNTKSRVCLGARPKSPTRVSVQRCVISFVIFFMIFSSKKKGSKFQLFLVSKKTDDVLNQQVERKSGNFELNEHFFGNF